jgi:hypothetical protein
VSGVKTVRRAVGDALGLGEKGLDDSEHKELVQQICLDLMGDGNEKEEKKKPAKKEKATGTKRAVKLLFFFFCSFQD